MSEKLKEKLYNLQRDVPPLPFCEKFDGVVLGSKFAEFRSRIENFEVRDDDVWVASFPKSGTTCTQEMVWLLANNLNYEGAKVDLDERFSFIEIGGIASPSLWETHLFPDPIDAVNEITGRRFIKTLLPWGFLPLQIRNGIKKPKIIYVIRNVKDVCVSYFHHHNTLMDEPMQLEKFFQLFITDNYFLSPYWGNVLSYWKNRYVPNLLIIKYEDMITDLASVIRQVAAFLEVTILQNEMEILLRHLGFMEMRKSRAVNKEPITESIKFGNLDGRYTFMRKGEVGGYKEELNEDMIQLLDVWTELNTVGSDFRYDF